MPTTTQDPTQQQPGQVPTPGTQPPLALAPRAPRAPQQPNLNTAAPSPTIQAPAQPVDRLKLATDSFNTLAQASEPAYQASLRDAATQAAGQGQLGSGQYRTSVGNLVLARQNALDTQRQDLLNKAVEGSIADATTAYQQSLSGAQQNLAAELGRGNLDIAQQGADTSRIGTVGGLQLQQSAQQQQNQQFGQSLALQQKQQEIDQQYQSGQLTLAQRDQALRELANTQQYGLAKDAQDIADKVALGQLTIAQAKQALDEKVANGTLTLQQAQLALAQLTEKDQNTIASGNLQLGRDQLQQQADQFKQSLAENSRQFGLTQDQQKALADMADATANRQIDLNTAQGKNQLLVQLAGILGGPQGTLNPAALAAIAKAFGIDLNAQSTTSTTSTTSGTPTGSSGRPPSTPTTPQQKQ